MLKSSLSQGLRTQMVKGPPTMQETWVWSLGWEDPLEEGMATHSSILVWRIPMDRGAWRVIVPCPQSDMTEQLSTARDFRGGTKGPWPCLMAKLLLFCLAWLFSFLHFLAFLMSVFFGTQGRPRRLEFFCIQEASSGHGGVGASFPRRPRRFLPGYRTERDSHAFVVHCGAPPQRSLRKICWVVAPHHGLTSLRPAPRLFCLNIFSSFPPSWFCSYCCSPIKDLLPFP